MLIIWITLPMILLIHEGAEAFEVWVSSVQNFSSEYSSSGWSADKIVGLPDVYPQYGDITNSWAQKDIDSNQYIVLEFSKSIYISSIDIYETYNGGGIKSVKLLRPDNSWDEVWWTPNVQRIQTSRIFTVDILPLRNYMTKTVWLDVDCTAAGTWVEIDAVQIKTTTYMYGKYYRRISDTCGKYSEITMMQAESMTECGSVCLRESTCIAFATKGTECKLLALDAGTWACFPVWNIMHETT